MKGEVLFVSSGLDRSAGGAALLGRLIARGAAAYCEGQGRPLTVLHGGREQVDLPGRVDQRAFAGDLLALGRTTWLRHWRRKPAAAVFDHVGPCRVEALLPPLARPPYLLFLLGIEVWRPLGWQRLRAAAKASKLLAISEHTRRRARPFLGPAAERAEVLPLALEETPPEGKADPALLDAAGEGFFLMVGRMSSDERYKGHEEVLAAFASLRASHPHGRPEVKLVIAGGGNDRRRLADRARELGLRVGGESPDVLFTGFVSEAMLAQLYRRSAALVLPSRNEGFGLVYLEAMRAGRPVIAARGSAAEEIVTEETGLLVDPGSPEEIAAALAHLLDHPEAAREMGRAGERRWRKHFSRARFEERLGRHLDDLLSDSHRAGG